jgi:hypothetical protein
LGQIWGRRSVNNSCFYNCFKPSWTLA